MVIRLGGLIVLGALLAACMDRSESYMLDCVLSDSTGCIRISKPGYKFTNSLQISSPNATYNSRTLITTLAVVDVVLPRSECTWVGPLQTASGLAIRIEPRPRANEINRTLFLDWRDVNANLPTESPTRAPAADNPGQAALEALEARRTTVLAEWNALTETQVSPWRELQQCLTSNAREAVRRVIALDWPTSATQAFAARTGFDLGRKGRALALQPGTMVCAFPAKEAADRETLEPASGPICATIANRPGGGTTFDPMIGRVEDPFAKAEPSDGFVSVSSWPEIDNGNSNFVLVNARLAPRKAGIGTLMNNWTTIVGFESGSRLLPRIVLRCAGETLGEDALKDLCGNEYSKYSRKTKECVATVQGDPEVAGELMPADPKPFACFRFANRTIVTAEIGIFVQGAPVSVAVGTTAGDVIDRYAPAPASVDAIGPPTKAVTINRQTRDLPEKLQIVRRFNDGARPVDFVGAGAFARDMPLLPGDALTW